jgi:formamidopyrimidine-DNA glycosylase
MPELPEVETSRRGIEPHIKNKTITGVRVRQSQLRWPVPNNLPELATGQKVNRVSRRAKYLCLELDHGTIMIHLGMSGSLRISRDKTPFDKHDHVDICFSNNKILRLRDPRRFGSVLWTNNNISEHKLIRDLGPEPLSDAFNADYLHNKAHKRSCSIKALIMNSHIVVGVGNIYACESLFKAGISPKRAAGKISHQRLQKLVDTIKQTLQAAIIKGGTTLRDFTAQDGKPGYFKQELLVYGRQNEACTHCGAIIRQIRQQNRSTCYCPQCQH